MRAWRQGSELGLRMTRWIFLFLLLSAEQASAAALCGSGEPLHSSQDTALIAFAHAVGIRDAEAFRGIANYLHTHHGMLPRCFLRKGEAERLGWHPGGDLWAVAPGAAIGGDRFANREARLPARWNGRYVEADLDYAGGQRGIKRLVFVRGMGEGAEEWLLFVTTDHEGSFTAFVPAR